MFILGLTGSIAMGKSTAAGMFKRLGCPVHDADAAVHRLLGPQGAAVAAVVRLFPDAADARGGVDRSKLGALVFADAQALKKLESVLHPMVRRAEEAFLRQARTRRERLAVLDIPLLFETGAEVRCHATAMVTAPAFVQRARALARPGMTLEKFARIRARQMSETDKKGRAGWVLPTGLGKRFTLRRIQALIGQIKGVAD
ncbi:MAG: dephospho-CoA kinase [Rhodospirillales bacterium]|nr:MAG: dephospho-CoA kinase [Rhodospirillales bacterium]